MKQRLPLTTKNAKPTKPQKLVPLIISTTFLLTIILCYFSYFHNDQISNFNLQQNEEYPKPETDPIRSPTLALPETNENPTPTQKPEPGPIDNPNLARQETNGNENPLQNSTSLTKNTEPETGPIESPSPARTGTRARANKDCDLFTGEWVPNPEGPYYTNLTCGAIQDHQNCMRYGRPDTGFLKWKWRPDGCELPVLDPARFLEMMRGKTIAFVGDSVARNHVQSLICLLSRVAYPLELTETNDQNKFFVYQDYDFNLTLSWAPYLVKFENTDPDDEKSYFRLHLDKPDPLWPTKIGSADYIIISAGPWFFRPTYFYLNNSLVGCLWCPEPEANITHLPYTFGYRWAFKTALQTINDAVDFNGVTFLRTYGPSHFEGGEWDNGGNCVRTKPFMRNETTLMDRALDLYTIQMEELSIAQSAGRRNSDNLRLFDATKPMLLRPDGHPGIYGHTPGANVRLYHDCVHWCLPGPIDSWNDFLQELVMREIES